MARTEVYVVATGAYGNIGDALIRRRALTWVRHAGQVHSYVGNAPDDWVEQLRFHRGDRVYRSGSLSRWLARGLFGRGRRVLVLDPGEVSLDRSSIKIELVHAVLTLGFRLRGGLVIRPPRGLVIRSRWVAALHRAMSSASQLAYWRDAMSWSAMRTGKSVPDTAFQEYDAEAVALSARDRVVVSLRSARPQPSHATLHAVQAFAAERGLSIEVVSQVRVDEESAPRLAATLGGTHFAWGEKTDAEQERALRELYKSAAIVITDRLHVAILAAALGAVPVEIVPSPNGKVERHFEQIGVRGVSLDGDAADADTQKDFLEVALSRREDLVTALGRAKLDVDAVSTEISRLLGLD